MVKMSCSPEAFVAFPSQEMAAIQGVVASLHTFESMMTVHELYYSLVPLSAGSENRTNAPTANPSLLGASSIGPLPTYDLEVLEHLYPQYPIRGRTLGDKKALS